MGVGGLSIKGSDIDVILVIGKSQAKLASCPDMTLSVLLMFKQHLALNNDCHGNDEMMYIKIKQILSTEKTINIFGRNPPLIQYNQCTSSAFNLFVNIFTF